VAVIGGHDVNDPETKAGFAVTEKTGSEKIMTNGEARIGDALVLTKPIGTGILTFAAEMDKAPDGSLRTMEASMAQPNTVAGEIMADYDAHACADVAGLGLLGHLAAMAAAGKVDLEINWDDVPLLPGVIECAARGIIPGATERNKESFGDRVVLGHGVNRTMEDILYDAQTSGGLLIALPGVQAQELVERLYDEDITAATIIGRVKSEGPGRVFVETEGARPIPEMEAVEVPAEAVAPTEPVATAATPEPAFVAAEPATERIVEIDKRFREFMKAAGAPGALDVIAKRAIAIALSVMTRSEPAAAAHINKARQMGFTQEQIDEAAWMAIAFGGSPVMLFYDAMKKS